MKIYLSSLEKTGVLILTLVLVLGLAGCNNNPQEDMFESEVNTLKSATTTITTTHETEVETEIITTDEIRIINFRECYYGIEMNARIVAYQAARAYLKGDMNELEQYLAMPLSDLKYPNETNIYDSLAYMELVQIHIIFDTMEFTYLLLDQSIDATYYYLYVGLINNGDEWKADGFMFDA